MTSYSLIFRSKMVVTGFLFLFIALIFSLASVFITAPVTYGINGDLGPGFHSISNSSVEYGVVNRTLILESKAASVEVLWDDYEVSYNITDQVVLHPTSIPSVNVLRGYVNYTYLVTETRYRYAYLAVPAFISLVVGVVLTWFGIVSVLGRR